MLEWTVLSYIRRKFADVNHISTQELENDSFGEGNNSGRSKDNSESGQTHVIIDCRRQDEYEVSHIPNAKHFHFQTNDESLKKLLVEETTKHSNSNESDLNIVCYCSLGYRSSMLAQRIQEMTKKDPDLGDKKIKSWNLEGSIFKWANESRPMTDLNEKSTKFVHPFSYTFCMLLQRQHWKWAPDKKEDVSEQ